MKRPAATLFLRTALVLGALLCTRASDAQDAAEATRDDVLAALLEGDYDGVDARLNALQQRFAQDDTAEEALLLGFHVFRSVRSDAEAAAEQALMVWVERYPRSYAARLARGIFCIERGLDARGTEYASKTSARQFEKMERWFERGREDLRASLELSAKPLLSHIWLITQAMRSGTDDDEQRYYRAALEYAQVKQRFVSHQRSRAHTSVGAAQEAPAQSKGWLAHTQDRRVQAVGLGLLLVLLIVARTRSRK